MAWNKWDIFGSQILTSPTTTDSLIAQRCHFRHVFHSSAPGRRLLFQVHHLQLRIAFDPSEVRRFALLAAGCPAHVLGGELTGFSDQNSWKLWMFYACFMDVFMDVHHPKYGYFLMVFQCISIRVSPLHHLKMKGFRVHFHQSKHPCHSKRNGHVTSLSWLIHGHNHPNISILRRQILWFHTPFSVEHGALRISIKMVPLRWTNN